jgi:hypothetical protein
MNKTQYNEIASAYKHEVSSKQYLYALGFNDLETRREYWDKLKNIEILAFKTANALDDGNDNFDRDVFLYKAGMMESRPKFGDWSFIPNEAYIAQVNE